MGFGLILMWSWGYNGQVDKWDRTIMRVPGGRLWGVALLTVWLIATAAGIAQAASPGGKATVSGVRAGNHGSITRFVLDLSGSVNFRVFTLANPYRVIIDLPELDWLPSDGAMSKPVGFITGFRHGLFRPGNARIVLDLTSPAGVKQAFVIPPRDGAGWRFVLDLEAVSHAAFMERQGTPPESVIEQAAAVAPPPPQPQATVQPQLAPAPEPAPQQAQRQPQPVSLAIPPAPAPLPEKRSSHRRPVVVVDPGHGGVDPGAIGVSGIYEKTLTLQVARQLKQVLERTGRYQVVLTREKDIFVPLRDRVAKARAAGADLFLSLHADAIADPSVAGLSVYTLSEKASDKEAAALADKENKVDLIAGLDLSHESPEVTNILIDLAQRETMNLSAGFASDMVDEIARVTKLLRNTHRFAGFAVLKAPDVPSVLIELGYLSNQREEQLLRTPEYRAKLTDALARSVDRYFLNVQKAQRP